MPSSRPSDARRAALKAQEAKKKNLYHCISNGVPIERYFDMAASILAVFERSMERNELDNAYIYGRRFATFSIEALPKHDYYQNRKKLAAQNQRDLQNVLSTLEQTADLMDLEELERQEIRRREQEALKKIREREEAMMKEEMERAQTADLLKRLNMLDNQFPATPSGFDKKPAPPKVHTEGMPSAPPPADEENEDSFMENLPIGDLPLPIPFQNEGGSGSAMGGRETSSGDTAPLPPPPSYDQLERHRSESLMTSNKYESNSLRSLQPAQHYSNGTCRVGDSIPLHHLEGENNKSGSSWEERKDAPAKVSMAKLKSSSSAEYLSLQQQKKVVIFQLNTYQGKSNAAGKDSTNGCAVISPLVVAHHLSSEGSGIADMTIEKIIDQIAPPLLTRVRNKLGLSGSALIIPSDVHDFLVDEKILKQDKFVGVCGGNILDPDHISEFLNMLEEGKESLPVIEEKKDLANTRKISSTENGSQKVAATLFFREHVISIVKVVLSDGTSWYDLVDSMPQMRKGQLGATRTRCRDRNSLQSVLLWMACNKFGSTNIEYIDNNDWDDAMCDLDPRVFQAFAWRE